MSKYVAISDGLSGAVPWNAGWTSEELFEVRPCRYAGGRLAVWQPHSPRVGKPIFAKPHQVRQRRSIAEMRCTVCGEITAPTDRWWFGFGTFTDGHFMTTESPVHHACALIAERVCPHIRKGGFTMSRLPPGYSVVASIVGGPAFERDFGIKCHGRVFVGSLKLAWPEEIVRRAKPKGSPTSTGEGDGR